MIFNSLKFSVKRTAFPILLFLLVISLSINAQPPESGSFRFAFVTDMHLKTNDSRNTETLRATIRDINAQNDLKFVIVAGDIADKGDRTSLLQAKQLLDSLKAPYYAIPGNHDTRYSHTATDAFDSVFTTHHFGFSHEGYFFVGFNTGQSNGNNRGGVNEQEFRWLKEQLNQNREKPVIAITHFPIVTFQVDDSAKIVNTLLKYKTKALLGGHYHRNAVFDYAGVPGILFRSLQTDTKGKSGYTIIEIGREMCLWERDPIAQKSVMWMKFPLSN
jgi:3',5'-cyclic AMP phosphodiesterase CpdA